MEEKKTTEQTGEKASSSLNKQFEKIRAIIGNMDNNRFSLMLTHNTATLANSRSLSSRNNALEAMKAAIAKAENIDKLNSAKEKLEASNLSRAKDIIALIEARIKEIEAKKLPKQPVQTTVSAAQIDEMKEHIENLFHEATLNEIESLDKELAELNTQLGGARDVIKAQSKVSERLSKISTGLDSFIQKIRDIRTSAQFTLLERELNKVKNTEAVLNKFNKLISETNDPKKIEQANDILLKFKKSHPSAADATAKVVEMGVKKWNTLSQEEKTKPHDWATKGVSQARQETAKSVQEIHLSTSKGAKK